MKNLKNYIMFAISYVFNAFGNALMIKGSVGALMWTSTFENFGNFVGVTAGMATSIISVIFYIVSKIIGRDFKLKDTIICLILSVSFGTLIDFFLYLIGKTPLDSVYLNYTIALVGMILISVSVSLAIEANVAFLALDDFLKNLKVYVFKGNVLKATYGSLGIGFIIAIITGLLYGQIANMTVLTIISSLLFGYLVQISDILLGFN